MENETTECDFDQQCDDTWNMSVEHRVFQSPRLTGKLAKAAEESAIDLHV